MANNTPNDSSHAQEPVPTIPGTIINKDAVTAHITFKAGEGNEVRTVRIHRELLERFSNRYRREFKDFKPGQRATILFPVAPAQVFSYIRNWFYSDDQKLAKAPQQDTDISHINLILTWYFADALEIPMLMNQVIDILLRQYFEFDHGLNYESVRLIYNETKPGSKLRALAVWQYTQFRIDADAEHWKKASGVKWVRNFCTTVGMMHLTAARPAIFDHCRFHVHEEGTPTCTKIFGGLLRPSIRSIELIE